LATDYVHLEVDYNNSKEATEDAKTKLVIQEYITDMKLLDNRSLKARVYVLVSKTDKAKFYISNEHL